MGKNRNVTAFWLVAAYVAMDLFYFLNQQWQDPAVMVHMPLDDMIPFCEWFAIPYVMWYGYVAVASLLLFLKNRDLFLKLAVMMVAGFLVCDLIFAFVPNGIAFRPTTFPRDNVMTDVVKWLYANDQPENVFPSLHVLDSLAVAVAIHHSRLAKRHRWVDAASWVLALLICLSTMFIKQHSMWDVLAATLLTVVLYVPIYRRNTNSLEEEEKCASH